MLSINILRSSLLKSSLNNWRNQKYIFREVSICDVIRTSDDILFIIKFSIIAYTLKPSERESLQSSESRFTKNNVGVNHSGIENYHEIEIFTDELSKTGIGATHDFQTHFTMGHI